MGRNRSTAQWHIHTQQQRRAKHIIHRRERERATLTEFMGGMCSRILSGLSSSVGRAFAGAWKKKEKKKEKNAPARKLRNESSSRISEHGARTHPDDVEIIHCRANLRFLLLLLSVYVCVCFCCCSFHSCCHPLTQLAILRPPP
jgi:hypothetical protein